MVFAHEQLGEEKIFGMRKTTDKAIQPYASRPVGEALSHVIGNLKAFSAFTASVIEIFEGASPEGLTDQLATYKDQLCQASDEITRHMATLGFSAIVTVTDLGLSSNGETGESWVAQRDKLVRLVNGHRAMRISLLAAMDVAEEADDLTVKLLRQHLNAQEKHMSALSALAKTYLAIG